MSADHQNAQSPSPLAADRPGRGAKALSRRARELTARLLAPVVTRAQLTRRAYALVSAKIRWIVCPPSAEVRYEALEFLLQHGVPIKLLRLAFYVDEVAGGRRFLNVEWESEPEVALTGVVIAPSVVGPAPAAVDTQGRDFRDVTLAEVAEHVVTPAGLVWHRPRRGETHRATLLAGGRIRLERGDEFSSIRRGDGRGGCRLVRRLVCLAHGDRHQSLERSPPGDRRYRCSCGGRPLHRSAADTDRAAPGMRGAESLVVPVVGPERAP